MTESSKRIRFRSLFSQHQNGEFATVKLSTSKKLHVLLLATGQKVLGIPYPRTQPLASQHVSASVG